LRGISGWNKWCLSAFDPSNDYRAVGIAAGIANDSVSWEKTRPCGSNVSGTLAAKAKNLSSLTTNETTATTTGTATIACL
jgi:hypothetical protein